MRSIVVAAVAFVALGCAGTRYRVVQQAEPNPLAGVARYRIVGVEAKTDRDKQVARCFLEPLHGAPSPRPAEDARYRLSASVDDVEGKGDDSNRVEATMHVTIASDDGKPVDVLEVTGVSSRAVAKAVVGDEPAQVVETPSPCEAGHDAARATLEYMRQRMNAATSSVETAAR